MKNTNYVKIQAPLDPWAIEAVSRVPGLTAATSPDAALIYGQNQEPIVIETKRYIDAGTAHIITARHAQAQGGPAVVVVTERSTAGAREVLDQHGVAYIDGMGNASIHLPGLIVRTGSFTGDAVIVEKPRVAIHLSGRAGLAAQAMLLEPKRRWKVADLANEAGVSAGLAHRVVTRLEGIGLVTSSGRGPRKVRELMNAEGLLDLWAEEDREPRLRRHAGYVLPERGKSLAELASSALEKGDISHAVTGVAAAALYEPTLTAIPITEVRVSSRASVDDAWHVLRGRRAEQGANVALLQAERDDELRFREHRGKLWVAARTRIYLDALRDPRRGQEQAGAFRPHVLTGP